MSISKIKTASGWENIGGGSVSDASKINNGLMPSYEYLTQEEVDTLDSIADQDIDSNWAIAIGNVVYPVGSIYISINNINPSNLFGGTWVSFGIGKTLVGVDINDTDFNSVEATGGEKTHTLTISEMPSHAHAQRGSSSGSISGSGRVRAGYTDEYIGTDTADTGGDQSHNNLQPYVTVYMWKRIV